MDVYDSSSPSSVILTPTAYITKPKVAHPTEFMSISSQPKSDEPPIDQWEHQPKPYWVTVSSPGFMYATAGGTGTLLFTIFNAGMNPDVYALAISSKQGWADVSGIPTSITLAPGERYEIRVPITIPPDTIEGTEEELELTASGPGGPARTDTGYATILVQSFNYLPLIYK